MDPIIIVEQTSFILIVAHPIKVVLFLLLWLLVVAHIVIIVAPRNLTL